MLNTVTTAKVYRQNLPSISRATLRSSLLLGILLLGMVAMTGCGQKGDLFITDNSRPTVVEQTSSEKLQSTSNPQDAAFSGIDDQTYQKDRYLEQQQVLPDPSDDPNDY